MKEYLVISTSVDLMRADLQELLKHDVDLVAGEALRPYAKKAANLTKYQLMREKVWDRDRQP